MLNVQRSMFAALCLCAFCLCSCHTAPSPRPDPMGNVIWILRLPIGPPMHLEPRIQNRE